MTNDSALKFNYEAISSFFAFVLRTFNNWFHQFAGNFENSAVKYLIIFLSVIVIVGIVYLVLKIFFAVLKLTVKIAIPIALVLLVVFAVRLYSKINLFNNSAVVTVAAADVKSGPFQGAETFFRLFEGNRVKVIGQSDDWYQIKRPDGKTGWIDKAALSEVIGSNNYNGR